MPKNMMNHDTYDESVCVCCGPVGGFVFLLQDSWEVARSVYFGSKDLGWDISLPVLLTSEDGLDWLTATEKQCLFS